MLKHLFLIIILTILIPISAHCQLEFNPPLNDGIHFGEIIVDESSDRELNVRLVGGEGAETGQKLELKLYFDSAFKDVDYTLLSGEAVYETDGLSVIELHGIAEVPVEYGLTSVYPNPFNSQTKVNFGLPQASQVELNLYDLNGRLAASLVSGQIKAGNQTVVFDGTNLSSGVYLLKLIANDRTSLKKIALVK